MDESETRYSFFYQYAYLVVRILLSYKTIYDITGQRSCVSFTLRFTDPESPGSFRFRKRIERLPGRRS